MLYNNKSAWNTKKGRPGQSLIGKHMLAESNSKNTALKNEDFLMIKKLTSQKLISQMKKKK